MSVLLSSDYESKTVELAEGRLHIPTIAYSFKFTPESVMIDGKILILDQNTGYTRRTFDDNSTMRVSGKRVKSTHHGACTTTTGSLRITAQGYVLGGSIGIGREYSMRIGKTPIQYAYKEADNIIYCAKVYTEPSEADVEANASIAVHDTYHCPTLIKVLEKFTEEGHTILILPFMPQSAGDMIRRGGLSERIIVHITMACLAAIAGLSLSTLGHGDVKPDNILLPGHKGATITLADLGSCQQVTKMLTSCTHKYGLQRTPLAGLQYDLCCLASTLGCLKGVVSEYQLPTINESDLLKIFKPDSKLSSRIGVEILENLTCNDSGQAIWEKALELISGSEDMADAASGIASWWPTRLQAP